VDQGTLKISRNMTYSVILDLLLGAGGYRRIRCVMFDSWSVTNRLLHVGNRDSVELPSLDTRKAQ